MQFRRAFVAGGTYFFTVNLLEWDKSLLTDHIDLLKTAFRRVKLSHHYERHIDYIYYNPVKHGYVDKPVDWPYSSIDRFIENVIMSNTWSVGETEMLVNLPIRWFYYL